MRFLVPGLTLLLVLTASAAQYQKPFGQLQDEQKFKDYTVRIYRNENHPPDNDTNEDDQDGIGCFEILRSGRQVFFEKGDIFKVGSSIEDDQFYHNPVKIGQSILGDKQPNLIVSDLDGGNNSLCDYYVFQIADTFKFKAKIQDSGGGEFKDLRGDGVFDLITYDELTFDYWHCCGADSQHPPVILRYRNGRYLPDLEQMKKPAPSKQELKKMAAGFRSEFPAAPKNDDDDKWTAPPKLWGKMLDLIYSGNMASAKILCDLSWPGNLSGKDLFWKDFNEQLQTSPYYHDIKKASFQLVPATRN